MKKKAKYERFDPNIIPDLLAKAQAGDLVARNQLLHMFQRLVATLVNVCITGKVNMWSSYQKTFLKLGSGKDETLQGIALRIKAKLTGIPPEELFELGQVAVLHAIDRCEKNLASTITYCFKEEINNLINDKEPVTIHTDYDSLQQSVCIENDVLLGIFVSSLEPEEQEIVERIMAGEKSVKIPTKLKRTLAKYLRPS